MDTTTKTTNTLELGEITEHDGYTMQEAGTIVLGKTTFTVKVQSFPDWDSVTWLTGPRGAEYTLEPVSILNDTGIRRVISFKSGAPLRVKGNEVRVLLLGSLIEVL